MKRTDEQKNTDNTIENTEVTILMYFFIIYAISLSIFALTSSDKLSQTIEMTKRKANSLISFIAVDTRLDKCVRTLVFNNFL